MGHLVLVECLTVGGVSRGTSSLRTGRVYWGRVGSRNCHKGYQFKLAVIFHKMFTETKCNAHMCLSCGGDEAQ